MSNISIRNFRFHLAAQQKNRRMVLETLNKVKRDENSSGREIKIEKNKRVVSEINYVYVSQLRIRFAKKTEKAESNDITLGGTLISTLL